eukprot:m.780481 g.780481  ORF g.780481 m.780481 type:complete len:358 (+) comp23281_c0_seq13:238-1311(+)
MVSFILPIHSGPPAPVTLLVVVARLGVCNVRGTCGSCWCDLCVHRSCNECRVGNRVFPLVKSKAVVLKYDSLQPVVLALQGDTLDEDTLLSCEAIVSTLRQKRRDNDRYVLGEVENHKLKTLYDEIFDELAQYARAYCRTSLLHGKLADCILQDDTATTATDSRSNAAASSETTGTSTSKDASNGFAELDKLGRMTEREKTDMNAADHNNAHFRHRPVDSTKASASGGAPSGRDGPQDNPSKLKQYLRQVEAFQANPTTSAPLEFPESLTSSERRAIHEVSDRLGLAHESRSTKTGRVLTVSKLDTAGAGTERPKRKRDDTGVNDGDGESLYAQMRSDLKTKAHAKRFAGWSDASAS